MAKFKKHESGNSEPKKDDSGVIEIIVKLRGKDRAKNITAKIIVAAGKVSSVAEVLDAALFG